MYDYLECYPESFQSKVERAQEKQASERRAMRKDGDATWQNDYLEIEPIVLLAPGWLVSVEDNDPPRWYAHEPTADDFDDGMDWFAWRESYEIDGQGDITVIQYDERQSEDNDER